MSDFFQQELEMIKKKLTEIGQELQRVKDCLVKCIRSAEECFKEEEKKE